MEYQFRPIHAIVHSSPTHIQSPTPYLYIKTRTGELLCIERKLTSPLIALLAHHKRRRFHHDDEYLNLHLLAETASELIPVRQLPLAAMLAEITAE